jgi:hypothetical protein
LATPPDIGEFIVTVCSPGYVNFRFADDVLIVDQSVVVKILPVGVAIYEESNPDFLARIEYVSETVNLLSPFTSNL